MLTSAWPSRSSCFATFALSASPLMNNYNVGSGKQQWTKKKKNLTDAINLRVWNIERDSVQDNVGLSNHTNDEVNRRIWWDGHRSHICHSAVSVYQLCSSTFVEKSIKSKCVAQYVKKKKKNPTSEGVPVCTVTSLLQEEKPKTSRFSLTQHLFPRSSYIHGVTGPKKNAQLMQSNDCLQSWRYKNLMEQLYGVFFSYIVPSYTKDSSMLPLTWSAIHPLFWCVFLCFGDIGCRDVCLFSSIMELQGTLLVVLKARSWKTRQWRLFPTVLSFLLSTIFFRPNYGVSTHRRRHSSRACNRVGCKH